LIDQSNLRARKQGEAAPAKPGQASRCGHGQARLGGSQAGLGQVGLPAPDLPGSPKCPGCSWGGGNLTSGLFKKRTACGAL